MARQVSSSKVLKNVLLLDEPEHAVRAGELVGMTLNILRRIWHILKLIFRN